METIRLGLLIWCVLALNFTVTSRKTVWKQQRCHIKKNPWKKYDSRRAHNNEKKYSTRYMYTRTRFIYLGLDCMRCIQQCTMHNKILYMYKLHVQISKIKKIKFHFFNLLLTLLEGTCNCYYKLCIIIYFIQYVCVLGSTTQSHTCS